MVNVGNFYVVFISTILHIYVYIEFIENEIIHVKLSFWCSTEYNPYEKLCGW